MNVRIKLPTFLAAAVAATLFASDLALAQGDERRLLKGSRVAIYNLVGSIRLEGGSGREVAVTVDRQGSDGARLKVETGEIGGRETLRVIYPDDRIVFERRSGEKGNGGRWGNWGRTQVNVARDGTFGDGRGEWGRGDRVEIVSSGRGFRGYADVRVAVPTGTSIEVHLAAGEAVVTNVDGDITVDVQAADVTTSHTRGALLLDTGSGEVNVSDAEGRVILDSGSGGATVTGMKGRELRLDTGSGSFKGSGIDVEELWGGYGVRACAPVRRACQGHLPRQRERVGGAGAPVGRRPAHDRRGVGGRDGPRARVVRGGGRHRLGERRDRRRRRHDRDAPRPRRPVRDDRRRTRAHPDRQRGWRRHVAPSRALGAARLCRGADRGHVLQLSNKARARVA
jgi:hypothetical protein